MTINSSKVKHLPLLNPCAVHFIDDFLKMMNDCILSSSVKRELSSNDIILSKKNDVNKLPIVIKECSLKDVQEIVNVFKDAYKSTYPYKEYENTEFIRNTLKNPKYHWLIYKNNKDEIIGCFMAILDFKNKRGNIGRFAFKQEYHGMAEVLKASIGTMYLMYKKYKHKIFTWFGEARTAHTKSQYIASLCGVKPTAILPNKDLFFNKVESEILQIGYLKSVFKNLKVKTPPVLIPECIKSFNFTKKMFFLKEYRYKECLSKINFSEVKNLEHKIDTSVKIKNFNYRKIKFFLNNHKSNLIFYYNPRINIIENIQYKVTNIEDFYCLITEISKFIREFNVRYSEMYLPVDKPEFQKILYRQGFNPRGYVLNWEYNEKEDVYEDKILFNHFNGDINCPINIIEEGKEIINLL